ncbi:hypothetical protein FDP22_07060 [Paroceanicella profunda]|uniref:Uncharacterized protein n=1 Tax=Paroceanicella profunda TaxID=2579971 RepID=A0A5B8FVX7_9RHOB|nr:hypothetical protein [Paroceanicella profunda]QDL91564.1 hypothetical protein FDP22_07060 [Paroceanicella profunda]
MKPLILAALLGAAGTFTAQADTLTLSAPMSGGTVHSGALDMSIYWTPSDEAFEVVAFYTARGDDAAPGKLQMRLEDGDRVVFGLPGHAGTAFSFERTAGALTVIAAPLQTELALN